MGQKHSSEAQDDEKEDVRTGLRLDVGIPLPKREWKSHWDVADSTALDFDPPSCAQPGTLAAAPRDVLAFIFIQTDLLAIYRASCVCKKFYLAARAILRRARPPSVLLCVTDLPTSPVRDHDQNYQYFGKTEPFIVLTRLKSIWRFKLKVSPVKNVGELSIDTADKHGKMVSRTVAFAFSEQVAGIPSQILDLNSVIVAVFRERLIVLSPVTGELLSEVPFNSWEWKWHVHERQDGSRFAFRFASGVIVDEMHVKDTTVELRSLAMQEMPSFCPKSPEGKTPTGSAVLVHDSSNRDQLSAVSFAPFVTRLISSLLLFLFRFLDQMITYNPETRTHSTSPLSGFLPSYLLGESAQLFAVSEGKLFCLALILEDTFSGSLFFLNAEMKFWSRCSLGVLNSIPRGPSVLSFDHLPSGVLAFNNTLLCVNAGVPEALQSRVTRVTKAYSSPSSSFILNAMAIACLSEELKEK